MKNKETESLQMKWLRAAAQAAAGLTVAAALLTGLPCYAAPQESVTDNLPLRNDVNTAFMDLQAGVQDIGEILDSTNAARQAAGVPPLVLDDQMCLLACLRAEDMGICFSHIRPDGTEGMDLLALTDQPQTCAWGENIAEGQENGTAVVAAWLTSAGHRANILSPSYTRIGIGVSGRRYVQLFSN
jgi:uncharacterized protein YkwD